MKWLLSPWQRFLHWYRNPPLLDFDGKPMVVADYVCPRCHSEWRDQRKADYYRCPKCAKEFGFDDPTDFGAITKAVLHGFVLKETNLDGGYFAQLEERYK